MTEINFLNEFVDGAWDIERAIVALQEQRPDYTREFILGKVREKVSTIVAGVDVVRLWADAAARGEKLPFETAD